MLKPPESTRAVPHTFHIGVMGTGFSIDTPLKVAPLGISSVVSLVDDALIEQMRQHWSAELLLPFEPIDRRAPDARARRITAYLDLLHDEVERRLALVREAPFQPGSPITRYFALLPDGASKRRYTAMLRERDPARREAARSELRRSLVAGSIDVNIMTKLDRRVSSRGKPLAADASDALAALRGYALSKVQGALVLSAGLNQRLFAHAASFPGFFPNEDGSFAKRIILKVSDYRSAAIQGAVLAKRGLWVHELRVESGINCGGHAFIGDARCLGPVLAEFCSRRAGLRDELFAIYRRALNAAGRYCPVEPPPVRVTAQGGIGTAEEDRLLREHYGVDGTGWASPFLLVPEVTNVDDATLERLLQATKQELELGDGSPLGIPFWNLTTSPSEQTRRERIARGAPGSPCLKGFVRFNDQLTRVPVCLASRAYQGRKLTEIGRTKPAGAEREIASVVAKACICHDLAGGATQKLGLDTTATTAICPGPNLLNFKRLASLDEMVDHIYGRAPLELAEGRSHMLVAELELYLDYVERRLRSDDAPAPRSWPERALGHLGQALMHYRGLPGLGLLPALDRVEERMQALEQPRAIGDRCSARPGGEARQVAEQKPTL